jgi:glycerophosphoryl diester phosphodiesterase
VHTDLRHPLVAGLFAVAVVAAASAQRGSALRQSIAHRGASAYAPEHTLPAYRLAMEQGADYVEQDLAVTKDGVLICLHDDTLERTSDVATVYPDRFSADPSVRGNGRRWIANDFTLDEIRRLDMGAWFDPKFAGTRIVTWQEAVDLVRGKAGMYPELKSPPLYTGRGIDMVQLFVDSVKKNGLDTAASLKTTPLIIQSFDEPTVRRVAKALPTVPRILLMGSFPDGGLTAARLEEIAGYATGIGPDKGLIDGDPGVVARAHAAGLTVTAYTFRSRSTGRFATVREEMAFFLDTLGIDALFTDNPDQFPR